LAAGGIVEELVTTAERSLEGVNGNKGLEGLKGKMKGDSKITARPSRIENKPALPYLETQIEKVVTEQETKATESNAAKRQQERNLNNLRNKREKWAVQRNELETLKNKREATIAQEEKRLQTIAESKLKSEKEASARAEAEIEAKEKIEEEAAAAKKKAEEEAAGKKKIEEEAKKLADKETAAKVKAEQELAAKKKAEEVEAVAKAEAIEDAKRKAKLDKELVVAKAEAIEDAKQKAKVDEELARMRVEVPQQQQQQRSDIGTGANVIRDSTGKIKQTFNANQHQGQQQSLPSKERESLPAIDTEKLQTMLQQLNISPGIVGGLAAATLLVGGGVTAVKMVLNDAEEMEYNNQEEGVLKEKDRTFSNNSNNKNSNNLLNSKLADLEKKRQRTTSTQKITNESEDGGDEEKTKLAASQAPKFDSIPSTGGKSNIQPPPPFSQSTTPTQLGSQPKVTPPTGTEENFEVNLNSNKLSRLSSSDVSSFSKPSTTKDDGVPPTFTDSTITSVTNESITTPNKAFSSFAQGPTSSIMSFKARKDLSSSPTSSDSKTTFKSSDKMFKSLQNQQPISKKNVQGIPSTSITGEGISMNKPKKPFSPFGRSTNQTSPIGPSRSFGTPTSRSSTNNEYLNKPSFSPFGVKSKPSPSTGSSVSFGTPTSKSSINNEFLNKPNSKQSFSPFGVKPKTSSPMRSSDSFGTATSTSSIKNKSLDKPKQSFPPFDQDAKTPFPVGSNNLFGTPTSMSSTNKESLNKPKQSFPPFDQDAKTTFPVGSSNLFGTPTSISSTNNESLNIPKQSFSPFNRNIMSSSPIEPSNQSNAPPSTSSTEKESLNKPKQSYSPFDRDPKPSSPIGSSNSFCTLTSKVSTKKESLNKPKQSFSPFGVKPTSLRFMSRSSSSESSLSKTNTGNSYPTVKAPLSTSGAFSKKVLEKQQRRTEKSRLAEVNRRVSGQVLSRDEEVFARKEKLRFKELEILKNRALNAASGIVNKEQDKSMDIRNSSSQEQIGAEDSTPIENPSSVSSVGNKPKSRFPFSSTGPVYMAPTSKVNNASSLDEVYSNLRAGNKNNGGVQEINKENVGDVDAVATSTTGGPKKSFSPYGKKHNSRSMFNTPSLTATATQTLKTSNQSTCTISNFGASSSTTTASVPLSFGVPSAPQPSTITDTKTIASSSSASSDLSTSPSIAYSTSSRGGKNSDDSNNNNINSDSGTFARPSPGQSSKKSFSPYGMNTNTKPRSAPSSFSVFSTLPQSTTLSNDQPKMDASSFSFGSQDQSRNTAPTTRAVSSSFSFGEPFVSTNLPQSTNQSVSPKIAGEAPEAPGQRYGTTFTPKLFATSAYSQTGGKVGRDERENASIERDRLKDIAKARKRAMDLIRDQKE